MSRPAAPRVRPDGGAAGVCDLEKQGRAKVNKRGKGGFKDHPENICRGGAAKSKGRQVQNYFRAWLEDTPDGLDCSRLDTLLTYLWDIASAANKQSVDAIKLLLERGYGKPQQSIDLSGTVAVTSFASLVAGDKAGE